MACQTKKDKKKGKEETEEEEKKKRKKLGRGHTKERKKVFFLSIPISQISSSRSEVKEKEENSEMTHLSQRHSPFFLFRSFPLPTSARTEMYLIFIFFPSLVGKPETPRSRHEKGFYFLDVQLRKT